MNKSQVVKTYSNLSEQEYSRRKISKPDTVPAIVWQIHQRHQEMNLVLYEIKETMEIHKQALLSELRKEYHGKHKDILCNFLEIDRINIDKFKASN